MRTRSYIDVNTRERERVFMGTYEPAGEVVTGSFERLEWMEEP